MNNKLSIFFGDLTHTGRGIISSTFPLGASYVASYANHMLNDYNIELFKFPEDLISAISKSKNLKILALSAYSWNMELSYAISKWAKNDKDLIVIFGGPNFPYEKKEKAIFLNKYKDIDFFIQNEGEIGFVELVKAIETYDFNLEKLKQEKIRITNCNYLSGGELMDSIAIDRITDVNEIPSPYLNGLLDKFFNLPLIPMLETTRGCPFSCAFCADGVAIKNKTFRFNEQRVKDEIRYIVERVKKINSLIITDLNFGMFKQDLKTAECIAEYQKDKNYPKQIISSAGKNKPDLIIQVARILNGTWLMGSSVQSTDKEVLTNIKRSNVPEEARTEFFKLGNKLGDDSFTYTEIMLALPGDTVEKFHTSVKDGIESGAQVIKVFQSIFLLGTELASPTMRSEYRLKGKFRVIPGCIGKYKIGPDELNVAEIEEIITETKNLTFQEYVSCRVFTLYLEIYHNDSMFKNIFEILGLFDVTALDVLKCLHDHPDICVGNLKNIVDEFIDLTENDLFQSGQEAIEKLDDQEIFNSYLTGERGINELLSSKAKAYQEFDDTLETLKKAMFIVLKNKKILNEGLKDFLSELCEYVSTSNKEFHILGEEINQSFSYDFSLLNKVIAQSVEFNGIKQPTDIQFYHTKSQKEIINNALRVYNIHTGGLGRFFQKNNVKKMFRRARVYS